MAAIKRDIIFRQVLANLNATPGAYAAALSTDEAYDDLAVMDAVLNTEAYLLHKIAESWFNGNRANQAGVTDIINGVPVNSGDLVPVHMGPVIGVSIDGIPAEACAAAEVGRLRAKNVLKLKLASGLYGLEDNRIYFTADDPVTQAIVFVFQFVRPVPANLAAFKTSDSPVPPEYQQAWVDLATGAVMSREGGLIQTAQMYTKKGEMVMQELASENRSRPMSKDAQQAGE